MAITIEAFARTPGNPTLSLQEITQYVPWMIGTQNSMIKITEPLPGAGVLTCKIFDPTNSIVVQALRVIAVSDTNYPDEALFLGMVTKVGIEPVATYRYLNIEAVDINWFLSRIPVGAPDAINGPGSSSWVVSGSGKNVNYTLIDAASQVYGSDQLSVLNLVSAYDYELDPGDFLHITAAAAPAGYVELINAAMGNLSAPPYWNTVTLDSALADVATLSSPATVIWFDMAGRAHLTQMPLPYGGGIGGGSGSGSGAGTPGGGGPVAGDQTLARMMPFGIPVSGGGTAGSASGGGGGGGCDDPISGSGVTSLYPAPEPLTDAEDGSGVGYENFEYHEDYTGVMTSAYARGATGWVYNPTGTAQVPASDGKGLMTIPVPVVEVGGTGLVAAPGDEVTPTGMSGYIDIPQATTQGIRDQVGSAAVARSQMPVITGGATFYTSNVWHRGMIATITNQSSCLDAVQFMVMHCNTTIFVGNDEVTRKVEIEFGSGPNTRLGLRSATEAIDATKARQNAPPIAPGNRWIPFISTFTQLYAGQVIDNVRFQFASPDGTVIRQRDLVASFAAIVINGVDIVTDERDFVWNPTSATSDPSGQIQTTLTLATNFQPGDQYTIYAVSPVATPI